MALPAVPDHGREVLTPFQRHHNHLFGASLGNFAAGDRVVPAQILSFIQGKF
jgi:hypothetical protein